MNAEIINTANKQKLSIFTLFLLSVLMAFTSLSVDIYLPQMPRMESDLHGNVELTITGFLIGFSIAQLLIGPISDRYGRRKPLVAGLILFVIGSVGCVYSASLNEMMFWRIIQAVGACAGPLLSRAMIRDVYDKIKAAELLSTLMMVMALAPIIGPVIGGYLNWHQIFWLLVVIGILMFLLSFSIPETLPKANRTSLSLPNTFGNYKALVQNTQFMRYTLCVTFFYVAIYAFIGGSPFVYIEYFGVPRQYFGLLFGVNILGLMLMSLANRKLVYRFKLDTLLKAAVGIALLGGVILIFTTEIKMAGIFGIIIPVFFIFSMNGIIAATTTAAALDSVPKGAGAAAALLGSLQYGSGILSTILLAVFSDGTPHAMAWIMVIFLAMSAAAMFSFGGSRILSVKNIRFAIQRKKIHALEINSQIIKIILKWKTTLKER